jgi:hypothetical protein
MKTTTLTFVNNSNNRKGITPLNAQQKALYNAHTEKIAAFNIFFSIDNNHIYGVRMPKSNIENRLTVYHDNIVLMLPLSKKQFKELIDNGIATYYCTIDELAPYKEQIKEDNNGKALEYFLEHKKHWKINHKRALQDGGDGYKYEIKFYNHGSTKHDRVIEHISEKM